MKQYYNYSKITSCHFVTTPASADLNLTSIRLLINFTGSTHRRSAYLLTQGIRDRGGIRSKLQSMVTDLVACLQLFLRSFPVAHHIVQELCESRGGRPGLSVLTSLLVSVDVKLY